MKVDRSAFALAIEPIGQEGPRPRTGPPRSRGRPCKCVPLFGGAAYTRLSLPIRHMNPAPPLRPVALRAALTAFVGLCACVAGHAKDTPSYAGPCDASAAVALDAQHFAVGNDEDNRLRVYRIGTPASLGALALNRFLGLRDGDEADIEGAAAVGTRVYWITSHARNAKGQARPARQRLFATDIVPGQTPGLAAAGRPYTQLLEDLANAPALARYALADASGRAAEAEGGLNIEGLAATPDGRLLIGLRNPLFGARALLVPLDNPAEVLFGGQRARLGTPVELDLGGRGIRSIEGVADGYLIVAGPTADEGSFALYRWSGKPQDAPQPLAGVALGSLRPEALFAPPGSAQFMLLSDDGGLPAGGRHACKDLPAARQSFRALGFTP